MTNKEKMGVECAERLFNWVVFESEGNMKSGELKEIIRKIFGTEIYELVEHRVKNGLTLTPIGDE